MTIEESAVAGVISGQINEIIKKLLKFIGHEIRLAWGLTEELKKLQAKLSDLSDMITGVLGGPIINKKMVSWLNKIKTVVYDAEDLLDEWSYKELENNIKIQATKNKPNKIIKKAITHQSSAHKVENLLKSIKDIYKQAKEDGIKPILVAAKKVYDPSPSVLPNDNQRLAYQRDLVDHKCFYGRIKDVKEIVALLEQATNTDAKLNVIGLVGMAGMGKTTLSKKVLNETKVKTLYEKVVSIVVSQAYDLNAVLKKIAENVCDTSDQCLNTKESYQKTLLKIGEKLKGKKYLLLLDDVWDTIDWETLRVALEVIDGSNGTTLLVTSRTTDVLKKWRKEDGMFDVHRVNKLDEDESWSLFMGRLCKDLVEDSEAYEIVKRMVPLCGGLPLGIKLLGDLLRIQDDIGKWREIENSASWKTSEEHDILPSLELSYKYLKSATLKTCFSYCAIFEEDEEINKDRLVRLWMAQGFLQPGAYVEMEVVGEDCFKYLLNSSLFQEPVMDRLGNVKSVKMHDLVRTLACKISRGDIWCYNQKKSSGIADDGDGNKVRHLSVSESGGEIHPRNCGLLRTLLMNAHILNLGFLNECNNLRALSFSLDMNCKVENTDWQLLGNLKHLRFLEIIIDDDEDATGKYIRDMEPEILRQIAKLYHLQTLCITTKFPFSENDTPLMSPLPKEFGNLMNLRHLLVDERTINIYEGLGHLTALQTLPTLNLKRKGPLGLDKKQKKRKLENHEDGKLSELQKLKNLRGELTILNLHGIRSEQEAQSLCLEEKSSLKTLCLSGFGNSSEEDSILEALKPQRSLMDLQIYCFNGKQLPTWLSGRCYFSNLVSLKLIDFTRVQGVLNLGKLISLRFLKLENCRELSITLPENGFKCCKLLEKLQIAHCDGITSISDLSPLIKLRSLTVLGHNITAPLPFGSTLSLTKLYTQGNLLPTSLSKDDPVCKSLKTLKLQPAFEVESLPQQIQQFVALEKLKIMGFESLESLPDFLGNMKSLGNLELYNLPELKCLPSKAAMDKLTNLNRLHILSCKKLTEEIQKKGEEWSKISPATKLYLLDDEEALLAEVEA